ncbi:DNA ligase/mRNA capping enzyme [Gonapodya prolifera JEL478]|uniref:DNA ligase/mRNA capping enzyme n=1 Tax=Gonapodya prolifera (strain JEL478) TaxID=1344416 RepID=A0A139AMI7_GONPJ|nr:DNA ligase/mRNA capping enzyme [Gonapodya prolifera JEL478]|eukprot:KXS17784.1 DNA ligase/mRNA capping enzyme [Gonapodya prolifera JEL478]
MSSKPACMYGASCYRKNPAHLAEYSHPGPVAAAHPPPTRAATPPPTSAPAARPPSPSSDGEDDLTEIDGVKPLKVLKDGDVVTIASKSSSSTYDVKRTWDHYYCTCPAWRNQSRAPVNGRTCKHLRELLGDRYEDARIKRVMGDTSGSSGPSASSPAKKRKVATAVDDDDDDDDNGGQSSSPGAAAKKVKVEVLLAQSYEIDGNVDPTGWWISEKLDGVRAYWDPKRRQFYSRLGNPFTPPDWFTETLPGNMSLDGELFVGRGKFIETVSVVKTMNSKHWAKVTFQVFDAPSIGDEPFESRLKVIEDHFAKSPIDHVKVVKQTKCTGQAHVLQMLKDVEAKGGEGLMLRKPASRYERTRSNTLLKVKSFYDAEAIVEGHEPGKGKNSGVMGALKCAMASGKKFRVGTGFTDRERANPPKVDSIITYRFQELTKDGVPRFPSYVGIRIDMDMPKDAVIRTVNLDA